jgi:hypothetical protein
MIVVRGWVGARCKQSFNVSDTTLRGSLNERRTVKIRRISIID